MLKYYKAYQGPGIFLGIFLAFVLGMATPTLFEPLTFISDIFINLLKLCSLPIISTSLVVTIGSLREPTQLKMVARNSIAYILATEIIAVTIALVIFNISDIGSNIPANTLFREASATPLAPITLHASQILNYLFTANIFSSLVKFDVLPIIIFSIMLGLACSFNAKAAKPVLDLFVSIRVLFLSLLDAVMLLAPLAIFVLVGSAIAGSCHGSALANLMGLLKFVGLFFGALSIHVLWQVLLALFLNPSVTAKRLFKEGIPILSTAFISSSSLATLPIAMEKAELLGGDKKVVEFMLPICASMNFASGMMYEMAAALFFMHILGIHPGLSQQILLAITCILTGIAVGGIPETSMVSFITIFNMVHIPLSAISVLMPLDRLVDRVRTMANIFSNTCGALTVSKTMVSSPSDPKPTSGEDNAG